MRKYLFIALGGMSGSILRFAVKNLQIFDYHGIFPVNIIAINIVGSFLLALILTVAFEIRDFDSDIRNGLTVGLLGAFTTFSAFCAESVGFLTSGAYFSAILYISVTILAGLFATYSGYFFAREVVGRVVGVFQRQPVPEIIEESEEE